MAGLPNENPNVIRLAPDDVSNDAIADLLVDDALMRELKVSNVLPGLDYLHVPVSDLYSDAYQQLLERHKRRVTSILLDGASAYSLDSRDRLERLANLFAQVPTVTSVLLKDVHIISPETMSELMRMLRALPSLRHFGLHGNTRADNPIDSLMVLSKELVGLPKLETLSLLELYAMKDLSSMPPESRLETSLQHLRHLVRIEIRFCKLSAKDCIRIINSIRSKKLVCIRVCNQHAHSPQTDDQLFVMEWEPKELLDVVKAFVGLAKRVDTLLQCIDLIGTCQAVIEDPDVVRAITHDLIPRVHGIRHLDMRGWSMCGEYWTTFCRVQLPRLFNLHSFTFPSGLTKELMAFGLDHLKALGPQLQILRISGNCFSHSTALTLSNLLPDLRVLARLVIRESSLTSDGLRAICDVLPPSFESIQVSRWDGKVLMWPQYLLDRRIHFSSNLWWRDQLGCELSVSWIMLAQLFTAPYSIPIYAEDAEAPNLKTKLLPDQLGKHLRDAELESAAGVGPAAAAAAAIGDDERPVSLSPVMPTCERHDVSPPADKPGVRRCFQCHADCAGAVRMLVPFTHPRLPQHARRHSSQASRVFLDSFYCCSCLRSHYWLAFLPLPAEAMDEQRSEIAAAAEERRVQRDGLTPASQTGSRRAGPRVAVAASRRPYGTLRTHARYTPYQHAYQNDSDDDKVRSVQQTVAKKHGFTSSLCSPASSATSVSRTSTSSTSSSPVGPVEYWPYGRLFI